MGGAFSWDVISSRPGMVVMRFEGEGVHDFFRNEPGGHRWQRVPPNEKRGRVQTSTVTVAVLPEATEDDLYVDPSELRWKCVRGSGNGGQHRNVTDSCVQLHHVPSGLRVKCESERSQHQNRRGALAVLRSRLLARRRAGTKGARDADRREQVGSGMRGDKVRTVSVQRGQVKCHRTGQKIPLEKYLRGVLPG